MEVKIVIYFMLTEINTLLIRLNLCCVFLIKVEGGRDVRWKVHKFCRGMENL